MKLLDVNVVLALFRKDHQHYLLVTRWLDSAIQAGEIVGLATQSAVGLVRIATNTRAFNVPSTPQEAFHFLRVLEAHSAVRNVLVGPRHLDILEQLCRNYDVRGKLVSDAHLAALALEHAATVVSFDRDFARFDSVKWEIPQ